MRLFNKAADYLKSKPKQTKSKEEENVLWAMLKEKFELGKRLRTTYERQWVLNLAFLAGRQYTFFNTRSGTIHELRATRGRTRLVDNIIWPRVRRQISDLIRTDPIISVAPSTTESEDIEAAKIGDKVLRSFWQGARMRSKVRTMAGWIYSAGNVFLDDRWNAKLGRLIPREDGMLEYEGDVDCEVWSPFEIYVPFVALGATELNSFPWLIQAKWRELEYYVEVYGSKAKAIAAEPAPAQFIDTVRVLGGTGGGDVGQVKGAVGVSLKIRPCQDWPKGLFLIMANGVLLHKEDYPFEEYNLEHFKDVDVPGCFWGKATMEDAISLQKLWNFTISDIREFNRTVGRGKWLVPTGSNLSVDPDDTHGQLINYKPVLGHKPEIMSLKSLPPSYQQTLESIMWSLNNVFSQHEVSQGTNRSDIRSGEMVAILREQDATGAIPAHALFEGGIERVMGRVLRRIKMGYTGQRIVRIAGRDEEYEVISFQGSDLRDCADVTIKRQSSLPESRAAREAQIMDRFSKGLYGDPADPEVRRHVMNLLDDAVVKDIYSAVLADERVAKWENKLLYQTTVVVNTYDNHGVHLQTHELELKKLDVQKLKVQNQQAYVQIYVRFLEHMQLHGKFVEEARQRMLEEQMAMKGGTENGARQAGRSRPRIAAVG